MNTSKSKCEDCGKAVVFESTHQDQIEYDVCAGCDTHTCCGRPNPDDKEDCSFYCQTCFDRFLDQTSVEYDPYFAQ